MIKLFNPIANAIAEHGTIDGIAMLEVENRGPRKIGWKHSKWPALFSPRATPIPSSKVHALNHEEEQATLVGGSLPVTNEG